MPPPQTPLPIDAVVAEIVDRARAGGAVVVEAPPGAGKTTRVPRALLDARGDDAWAAGGEIWVLEPRRLPARLAAARVAFECGENVGGRVGYSVRFDEVSGPRTRLRFMTEGVFVRRLLADPTLRAAAAIVVDELHERHVSTDLALAWARHLRGGRGSGVRHGGARPDLTVLGMSATLAAEPVREFLSLPEAPAALVRSEGRRFEVAVEYLSEADARIDRPLERHVAGAVKRVLREQPEGDVLVFLPGASEIRRAQAALAESPTARDLAIYPLHGDMPIAEQTRAVDRADRRKVVLATNVAESSVTIDGVVAVIDSGLARVAAHSPWTGLPTLALAKISRAAADQRAGRAGRTRPGRALRLYTRADFEQRPAHDAPEIARADLAELAMTLAVLGVRDAYDLAWMDPPPAAAWGNARELLTGLGAIDATGELTDVGVRLQRLPVHPRLARVVVEGAARGAADAACLAAALIAERDIRARARTGFGARGAAEPDRGCDVAELVDLYRDAEAERFRPNALRRLELDARAVEEVRRAHRQLAGALGHPRVSPAVTRPEADTKALRMAVLTGFADRVAERRAASRTVRLAGGGAAELGYDPTPSSASSWLVVVDVEERRARGGPPAREPLVRLGSAIEPEWLLDLYPERVVEVDQRAFDGVSLRVERRRGLGFGTLMLDERTEAAPADGETARLLAEAALARGIDRLPGAAGLAGLRARLAFAREVAPDVAWPDLGADALAALLRLGCAGRRSFAELAQPDADLTAAIVTALPQAARHALDTVAPERIRLPGGRTVPVHYDSNGPPWIESRLQDFFGVRAAPTIGGGRTPLTVHLLAPNGRAVQVTRDLAGFWAQHYPALRRELCRRYPKHAWPEDGAAAKPPPPSPARRR
jgi:ATP-dependent RNA helicase HrpB